MLKNKNYRRIEHKAFTISELLIALGVIAILTSVLMPIIHNLIPNQNVLMAKRAFYTTETVINNIINDNECYPQIRARVGFTNGSGYRRCPNWDQTKNNNIEDPNENANEKFLTLFTESLDIKSYDNDQHTAFKTKDGVQWNFSSIGFSNQGNTTLIIDVNSAKGPNCGQAQESGACEAEGVTNFDKFTLTILPTGKIEIKDCWAVEAAKTDKKLIGNELNCAQ